MPNNSGIEVQNCDEGGKKKGGPRPRIEKVSKSAVVVSCINDWKKLSTSNKNDAMVHLRRYRTLQRGMAHVNRDAKDVGRGTYTWRFAVDSIGDRNDLVVRVTGLGDQRQ